MAFSQVVRVSVESEITPPFLTAKHVVKAHLLHIIPEEGSKTEPSLVSLSMTWKLFLDDIRRPVDLSWTVAISFDEAVRLVTERGCPSHIAFDHDLGEGKSGFDFAKWLVYDIGLRDFSYSVHSSNGPGSNNISGLLCAWTGKPPVKGPVWFVPEED